MSPQQKSLALSLLILLASLPASGGELAEAVDAELPALLETYRHLHANPEISYLERETSQLVAERLRELGFDVTEEVGDYGVEGRVSYGVVGGARQRRRADRHGAYRPRRPAGRGAAPAWPGPAARGRPPRAAQRSSPCTPAATTCT